MHLKSSLLLAVACAVGAGAAVHGGVRLRFGTACTLGARSVLYRGETILATGAGRFRIGRDSHLAPGAYVLVGGQTLDIGDDVAIGAGLMLFCESNDAGAGAPFRSQYRRAPVRRKTTTIASCVATGPITRSPIDRAGRRSTPCPRPFPGGPRSASPASAGHRAPTPPPG